MNVILKKKNNIFKHVWKTRNNQNGRILKTRKFLKIRWKTSETNDEPEIKNSQLLTSLFCQLLYYLFTVLLRPDKCNKIVLFTVFYSVFF